MGKLTKLAEAAARRAARTAARTRALRVRAAEEAAHGAERARIVAERRARSLAVPVQRQLPAPPKPLAITHQPGYRLNQPGSKPKGGQWHPDANVGPTDPIAAGWQVRERGPHSDAALRYELRQNEGSAASYFPTEDAAMEWARRQLQWDQQNFSPENLTRKQWLGSNFSGLPLPPEKPRAALDEWFNRAYPRYLKSDFATEGDPMRDLAVRGLHPDPEMTPEAWDAVAGGSLMEDPIGYYTVPAHANAPLEGLDAGTQESMRAAAPWLTRQPVTDPLYGLNFSPFDTSHMLDEMHGAMTGNVPSDLAVRPESLSRMSFPQAAEHVGRINQYRAAEMDRASLAAMDNPAIQPFKDYPDDPRGMRWVQIAPPRGRNALPEGHSVKQSNYLNEQGETVPFHEVVTTDGDVLGGGATPDAAIENALPWMENTHLAQALQQEGDQMGHCVGGYCRDVQQGYSSIFSLRDAKGKPHVTIETTPRRDTSGGFGNAMNQIQPGIWDDVVAHPDFYSLGSERTVEQHFPDVWEKFNVPSIIQIKGKQNAAPVDEYLPYVQDFVKSGDWSEIGDLQNTGLTRLPDGRYLPRDQVEALYRAHHNDTSTMRNEDLRWLQSGAMGPEDGVWLDNQHLFEGYAYGGRVEGHRDFARGGRVGPYTVRIPA